MFVGVCGEGGKVEEREDVLELGRRKERRSLDGAHVFRWSTVF